MKTFQKVAAEKEKGREGCTQLYKCTVNSPQSRGDNAMAREKGKGKGKRRSRNAHRTPGAREELTE
jgi:hypothetical protein